MLFAWFVVIFGINTKSDISKLLEVISRAVTHKSFVIFTSGYFKLSWNTTALSQSNCGNFSCSSITDGTYYAWHQLLHLCLLQTSNSTLVFKLWEESCTGSLNNTPVDLADMLEDEVQTPLPLYLNKPLEK